MKLFLFAFFLLQAGLVCAQNSVSIESASWLAGCWVKENDSRQTTEMWLKPAGNSMLGVSRTVSGGKTVEFEFMRIAQQDGGTIEFIALPSGQSETAFRLVSSGAKEMIFENPEHDFPQRVIYKLKEDGSLFARIEGKIGGKEKGVDFPMNRIRCD